MLEICFIHGGNIPIYRSRRLGTSTRSFPSQKKRRSRSKTTRMRTANPKRSRQYDQRQQRHPHDININISAIYLHIYIYIYIGTTWHIYIWNHVRSQVHIAKQAKYSWPKRSSQITSAKKPKPKYIHIWPNIYIGKCMNIYIYIYIYICISIYSYFYLYVYMHPCIYTATCT